MRGFIAALDNIRGDSIIPTQHHPSFHPINIYERFMSIQQEAGLKQYITARYNIRQPLIISVCTEMEFLNGILVEVFGHELESSEIRVFYPHFSVLQNAIHE